MNFKTDWDIVTQLACDITNYTIANDEIASNSKRKEILNELDRLRSVYGERSFIIMITALYTLNSRKKLLLFEKSYQIACGENEYDDSLATANSAFQFCLEETLSDEARVWGQRVNFLLTHSNDAELLDEARELLSQWHEP